MTTELNTEFGLTKPNLVICQKNQKPNQKTTTQIPHTYAYSPSNKELDLLKQGKEAVEEIGILPTFSLQVLATVLVRCSSRSRDCLCQTYLSLTDSCNFCLHHFDYNQKVWLECTKYTWDCKWAKTLSPSTVHQKLAIIGIPRKLQRGQWEADHSPDNCWKKERVSQPKGLAWGPGFTISRLGVEHIYCCVLLHLVTHASFWGASLRLQALSMSKKDCSVLTCIILYHSWTGTKWIPFGTEMHLIIFCLLDNMVT